MTDHSTLFIVNPNSSGNETGKLWEKTFDRISTHLNGTNEYIIADGIGTGVTETQNAIKTGNYSRIVAVGGEGTINEVVNGIYTTDPQVPLGFIRGGTVNDYLNVIGWPRDLDEQIKVLNEGELRKTPISLATGDTTRYSLNMTDIGVAALISIMASVNREMMWIKSRVRYDVLAIKAILKWKNIPCTITTDDEKLEGDLSLLMSGFSTSIGDYKSIPHAEQFSDRLAYTIAFGYSKIGMIRLMGPLKKGEIIGKARVHTGFSSRISVESEIPILFEVDGEPFSYNTNKVSVEAVPDAIKVYNPKLG
ncbi:MAG: hypothetical protein INQ03_19340 [Candidatus Heimdallarchaeota archaeon]|nr:hypothetical protein [Candidatus Heimdallarchaeota archaeon]